MRNPSVFAGSLNALEIEIYGEFEISRSLCVWVRPLCISRQLGTGIYVTHLDCTKCTRRCLQIIFASRWEILHNMEARRGAHFKVLSAILPLVMLIIILLCPFFVGYKNRKCGEMKAGV